MRAATASCRSFRTPRFTIGRRNQSLSSMDLMIYDHCRYTPRDFPGKLRAQLERGETERKRNESRKEQRR